MRQVIQSVKSGDLKLVEIPTPVIGPTEVLVRTTRSVVSAGTERAVRNLAKASLFGKAKARPDLVKQVVQRARADGIRSTMKAVRTRLDEDMPLGYSAAGVAVEVGEHVAGIRPGMRVATGGAGHGEFQVVAANLCVPIPDGVSDEAAAFSTVAAIALQGLRQADVQVGGRVAVIGLGLVGRLTVRLASAAGIDVVGLDVSEWPVEQVKSEGHAAHVDTGADTTAAVLDWSRGHGVDAVLLTAATPSSEPIARSVEILRDRGTLVVVGDVGMELERTPLYEKEITIRLARSYGPGRYERSYEEWGVDYPIGQVRWSEGRNVEAVLDLQSAGRLDIEDLVTHRYDLDDAATAYEAIEGTHGPFVGVQLRYPDGATIDRTPIRLSPVRSSKKTVGVGLLGAGNYAKMTMVPALKSAGGYEFVSVASAGGASARHLAERHGFASVATDATSVINNDDVDLVMIATPHSTHADLVIRALQAGKHVFCEKPLGITEDELDAIEAAASAASGQLLMVGFNRRFAPMIADVRDRLSTAAGPLVMSYKVNAGSLPDTHWFKSRTEGGRLIGEACHFVDTCAAIAGAEPVSVALAGAHRTEATLVEDFVLAVTFADGSSASIAYASGGHPGGPKERVTIMGRGHTLEIDDYRSLHADGDQALSGAQDKGHATQFRRVRDAVLGKADLRLDLRDQMAVSRAVVRAVGAAGIGRPEISD
ncbi:MAG: bi-domain-containing oxidoreductase [Acidimicrobiales bacterium]|nr:bi-domain-containing oxidoreductase [Acidimicrobiales bacterium]